MLVNSLLQYTLSHKASQYVNPTHSYHDHLVTVDLTHECAFITVPLLHLYEFSPVQGYNILQSI